MKDRQVLGVLVLGGLAWWYLSQQAAPAVSEPLGFGGGVVPLNNMQSLVKPSYTTSTAATNPNNIFAAAAALLNKAVNSITGMSAGNAPIDQSAPFLGIEDTGLKPASLVGVTPIGSAKIVADPVLDNRNPFWGWGLGDIS